jgi:SAM-dependent methyltransferase
MRESVGIYARYEGLNPSERIAFDLVAAEFKGKAILDLGVGGGRTTPALAEISNNYLGVDYMPEMVAACQARFPDKRFAHVDARAMPQFADRSFDLIVFACNGVCMVDQVGRLAILREVRRLLVKNGVFIFSSYNTNCPEFERWFEFPRFNADRNPIKLAINSARFAVQTGRGLANRVRNLRHEVRTNEYSIINDRCHDYATMLYYISMDSQLRQLNNVGFESTPTIYDAEGRAADEHCRSDSLTYVVRG